MEVQQSVSIELLPFPPIQLLNSPPSISSFHPLCFCHISLSLPFPSCVIIPITGNCQLLFVHNSSSSLSSSLVHFIFHPPISMQSFFPFQLRFLAEVLHPSVSPSLPALFVPRLAFLPLSSHIYSNPVVLIVPFSFPLPCNVLSSAPYTSSLSLLSAASSLHSRFSLGSPPGTAG